ncbi:MAG: DNA polymerase III subunit delta [Rikenellaceae bacterium]
MRFAQVIALDKLKQQLRSDVNSSRISHAQMFCGEQGGGSYPLALAYATYIMCENPTHGDSCGECASCYKMDRLAHPDLHFVFPVNDAKASSTDKPTSDKYIQQWRDMVLDGAGYINISQWYKELGIENKQGLIRREEANEIIRKVSLKSFEGGYKVVIVFMPELLRDEAANSLLKVIEEPPAQTLFLFVSSQSDRIIGTIRSRVQSIVVPPLSDDEIAHELVAREITDRDTAQEIAHSVRGNWGRALQVAQSGEDDEIYQEFVGLMRLCYLSNYLGIFDWVNSISSRGREFHKRFCTVSLDLIRDCYMEGIGLSSLNFALPDRVAFVRKFAPFANHSTMDRFVQEYELLLRDLTRNGNSKIVFTHFALTLCKIFAIAKMEINKTK